jgi:hypothetical protein
LSVLFPSLPNEPLISSCYMLRRTGEWFCVMSKNNVEESDSGLF